MGRGRLAAAGMVGALVCTGVALSADLEITALPRPTFPPPAAAPDRGQRLMIVSSVRRDPSIVTTTPAVEPGRRRSSVPGSMNGAPLLELHAQGLTVFLLYGRDGTLARYLVAASMKTKRLRYAFDFGAFMRPPRVAAGEGGLVPEQVVFAREADGVLYVENAHSTYAASSYGRNAYITAIDLRTKRILWRSRALVANADTFVVAGDALVTGYGFTREPDYLYVLDRRTGRVLDRLLLPSAPERIVRHGSRLDVATYDHDVVVTLHG